MTEPLVAALAEADAASLLAEYIHTGLRKGSDDPQSGPLWSEIHRGIRAWNEACSWAVHALRYSGYVVTSTPALAAHDDAIRREAQQPLVEALLAHLSNHTGMGRLITRSEDCVTCAAARGFSEPVAPVEGRQP